MRLPIYTDLEGVEGRVPVGATITIGTKGDKGAPVDRDRFYIKSPKQDSSKSKPNHPMFAAYNGAPADRRRALTLAVVHEHRREWITSARIAYRVKSAPPMSDKRPWCVGDGRQATRYDHKSNAFADIACPNERCQFAQGVSPECKPILRIYAQPVWPVSADGRSLPSVLCSVASHSWHGVSNAIGMIEHVEAQARHLGIESFSWYGFTFSMLLTEQTNVEKRSKFPVLVFSPACDVQEWLLSQARRRDELAAAYTVRPAALTEATEHSGETIAEIIDDLAGPR